MAAHECAPCGVNGPLEAHPAQGIADLGDGLGQLRMRHFKLLHSHAQPFADGMIALSGHRVGAVEQRLCLLEQTVEERAPARINGWGVFEFDPQVFKSLAKLVVIHRKQPFREVS